MSGFKGIDQLIKDGGFYCESCKKFHAISLGKLILERGAIEKVPAELAQLKITKPYILTDPNTYKAAGERLCAILDAAGVSYKCYTLSQSHPMPDEHTLGEAAMRYDASCDGIIAVGGGVINDTAKMLTNLTHKPFLYVPTAPSMDGYASTSSSMDALGLKTTIASIPADTIVADTDIIAAAPMDMILAGIGDMAAKYVSLVEWKMAPYITGEYYCPEVAEMMKSSLDKVISVSKAAVKRDPDAIAAVVEGLVLAGLAMTAAGVSRPASGMEHYMSHIRDMRSLEYGTRDDLHGLQCGYAVLICLCKYEQLLGVTPDREKALAHAAAYDYAAHAKALREYVGVGAESMIKLEGKEGKYDPAKLPARLDRIIANWDTIKDIIRELPSSAEYEKFCLEIGFPTKPEDLGMDCEEVKQLLRFGCDVRDKYVMSRLFWDFGLDVACC